MNVFYYGLRPESTYTTIIDLFNETDFKENEGTATQKRDRFESIVDERLMRLDEKYRQSKSKTSTLTAHLTQQLTH